MVDFISNIQLGIKLLKKISSLLNKTLLRPTMQWLPFAKEEFKNAINKCNNLSFLEPDYISWKYPKKDNKCLLNIINIANTCIDIGY